MVEVKSGKILKQTDKYIQYEIVFDDNTKDKINIFNTKEVLPQGSIIDIVLGKPYNKFIAVLEFGNKIADKPKSEVVETVKTENGYVKTEQEIKDDGYCFGMACNCIITYCANIFCNSKVNDKMKKEIENEIVVAFEIIKQARNRCLKY